MHALDGIRVLDLTRVLAGPYATMILADLGAEVIKVEPPEGDEARGVGPFQDGVSVYFLSINRGKRSVALDLKHPHGRDLLFRLLAHADVVVENYRPGTMAGLGLDYATLHAAYPRLIYAACSGFGQTGPYATRGAYDMIIQGMGGIISVTGEPGRPPVRVGISIGDLSASLFTVVGILSALHVRDQTSLGQMVDVGMLDCQVALLENAIARYETTGVVPGPMGSRHPAITPFQAFETRDGYAILAIGNDAQWTRFCQTVGRPDLATDERFTTNARRTEHADALLPILTAIMASRTTAEWVAMLDAVSVPCGPINTIDRVLEDPQVAAREMIVRLTHARAGSLRVPGTPVKLSDTPGAVGRTAPDLGQHTGEVLTSLLGLAPETLDRLRVEGVIQ